MSKPICHYGHELPIVSGYCFQCAICRICNQQISGIEYEWCLTQWTRAVKLDPTLVLVFEHPNCISAEEREALANKTVEVPQRIFDKLNAARLLFEVSEEVSKDTNTKQAEIFNSQWCAGMSYEQLCLHLIRLESAASNTMLLIGRSHKDIDIDLSKRDKELASQAQAERTQHRTKAPATKDKYEKKAETAEEKAFNKMVSTFMHLGMSREDSEAQAKDAITKRNARIAK